MKNGKTTNHKKIKVSISTKIIGMIALLLCISIISIVFTSSDLFVKDNTALIQQINSDTANNLASQVREIFQNLTEKTHVLGTYLYGGQRVESQERAFQELFKADKDFIGVELFEITQNQIKPIAHLFNEDYKSLSTVISDTNEIQTNSVLSGEVQIINKKLSDDTPVLYYIIPLVQNSEGKFINAALSVVKLTKVLKIFSGSDLVTSYLVDHKGRLIAHPEAERAIASESFSNNEVVKKLHEGKFNNGQTRFTDIQTKEAKLGAFKVVGLAGMGVVSEVLEEKAFEAAKVVVKRSAFIGLIVMSIAFFIGFMNSRAITNPILKLVEASKQIAEGNFNINLSTKGSDEVAHLSQSFNEMATGLEERDRVKETFSKFHSKEIAEKLLSGEVKLGGERRKAIIFFSDVRGFTGMSEKMQPEEVVEMLNEYMTKMVSVITKYKGIVDKYVGDAIMALWGVPLSNPNDYSNAVMACLEMRLALNELNQLRISRGQTPLKIGMGLNTGEVIAGNIGSNEKMEYTVIGDSVNLASRIESMTKEYGTDLLISNYLYEHVKEQFIFEECEKMKVKGKSDAISVYKVNGYIDHIGKQIQIKTPYSSYEAEKSDKVVHDKKQEDAPKLELVEDIAESQWYISFENEQYGPFSKSELIEGISKGEINPQMMVSTTIEGNWIQISEHLEFVSYIPKAA